MIAWSGCYHCGRDTGTGGGCNCTDFYFSDTPPEPEFVEPKRRQVPTKPVRVLTLRRGHHRRFTVRKPTHRSQGRG